MGSCVKGGDHVKSVSEPPYWHYLGLEQKQRYPRNLVLSMIVVNGAIIALALMCMILPVKSLRFAGKDVIAQTSTGGDSSSTGVGADQESSQENSAGGSTSTGYMAMPLLNDVIRNGYIPNIRIIPDNAQPVALLPSVSFFTDAGEPILETDFDPVWYALARGEGGDGWIGAGDGDEDYGLPAGEPFMPQPVGILSFPDYSNGVVVPLDNTTRDAIIITRGTPRWPRKGQAVDSAVVVVRFDIKTNGTLRNFNILDETPEGLDFGEQLIAWIDTSFVQAGMVNGKKITTTITVNYIFDPSKNRMIITKSSGDIDFQAGL